MSKPSGIRYWLQGIRLYIAIGIGMATLEIWWWSHAAFGSGELATIRLQETYAWFSVGLLATALAIGPLTKLVPELPGKPLLFDARRLLGIGAAWFASLHMFIAYASQFQFANPLTLAGSYRSAFALGIGALTILLAMAFTSFDAALKGMGVWWFRLHRLVYAAGLLALVHIFMIGVHATTIRTLGTLGIIALALITLHVCAVLRQTKKASKWQVITIVLTIITLGLVMNYGVQQYLTKNAGLLGDHTHQP